MWNEGQRVVTTLLVAESGFQGNPDVCPQRFVSASDLDTFANDLNPLEEGAWVHAYPGEGGEVVHVNGDGVPTVMFDVSRTATIVGDHEVAPA